jgi:23S rRNA (adenine2503-C2)-methyltransferase
MALLELARSGEDRSAPPPLLALSPAELGERLGGVGRAKAVYGALRRGRDPFAAGVLAPGARRRLIAVAGPTALRISAVSSSADGTRKLLLSLADGRAVEAVLIPTEGRTTLCLSTQVGCARGCCFCATGRMGLLRNLTCDEIVGQVVLAQGLVSAEANGAPPIKNLVLMGMGEPLDNLRAVRLALEGITAEAGLGFGRRHVTLSTVGPSPEAVRAALGLPAHLAWSLHAADDDLRRRLVPTARHGVRALLEAFRALSQLRGDPLFVEITLIDGLNDATHHAERVVDLFRGYPTEVRVNLLPMNAQHEVPRGALSASPPERVDAFGAVLHQAGHRVIVRRPRGASDRAACGQLALLSPR